MFWKLFLLVSFFLLNNSLISAEDFNSPGLDRNQAIEHSRAAEDYDLPALWDNAQQFPCDDKSTGLEYINSFFWTDLTDIVVEDGYAYCALTYGLMIFDVSDGLPFDTVSALFLPSNYGRIGEIEKNGNILYVSRRSIIYVIDVTDAANPAIMGKYKPDSRVKHTAYYDNLLFLAQEDSSFAIIDVSVPSQPEFILKRTGFGALLQNVYAKDGIALITCENSLYIYDITYPMEPKLAATYEASLMTNAILSDNIAYVSLYQSWHNVMHILDLTDLDHPKLLSTYTVTHDEQIEGEITLKDSLIFFGSDIINVSDPWDPHLIYQYRYSGCHGMDIYDNKIYVLYFSTSIFVYDMSLLGDFPEASHSIFLGRHLISQYNHAVIGPGQTSHDSIIFVSIWPGGIYSVDVSDINNPQIIGYLDIALPIECFDIQKDILYAGGLLIDISNPADMKIVAELSGLFSYSDVIDIFIYENLAFLVVEGNYERLYVYDIENPLMPIFLSLYEADALSYLQRVAVKNGIAYLTAFDGLRIIDYSNPALPQLITTYGILPYSGIAISDTLAYLGGLDFEVLNISDPSNPVLIGTCVAPYPSYPTSFISNAMELNGDYIYFAGQYYSITVMDISDPLNPSIAEVYTTPSEGTEDIFVSGNRMYLADRYGIMIVDKSDYDGCVCGDINADGSVDISDAVHLISYIFTDGTAPEPIERAELNCDSEIDVADIVYVINYVFLGGNSPCDTNGDGIPDC